VGVFSYFKRSYNESAFGRNSKCKRQKAKLNVKGKIRYYLVRKSKTQTLEFLSF